MKTKFLSLFIFSLLINLPVYAKKQYLLIGGGGEPTGDTTIFDGNLTSRRNFLNKASDWQKEVSFNGGHSTTENILKSQYKDSNSSNFTAAKYKEIINKYVAQLKSGELKRGDQLLIQIDSHGATKINNQETHSIATAKNPLQNYETLGEGLVNLDELKKITTLAKEKGVKVAIIDQSCHSGNSLSLADDNTCVLSVTGPNHYGYVGAETDSRKIIEKMSSGKNLEDIFLEARLESNDPGFPMISSPSGQLIQNELYQLLTPYLYYFDKTADKLTPYLLETKEDLSCKLDKDYEQIQQIINKVEDLKVVTKQYLLGKKDVANKKVDLSNLKEALADYYAYQKDILKEVAGFDPKVLDKDEKITVQDGNMTRSMIFDWRELISMDFTNIINNLNERIANTKNETDKRTMLGNIEIYKQAKKRGEELANKYPQYNALKNKIANLDMKEEKTNRLATKIGKESRILYNELYKGLIESEETNGQINPCEAFVI